MANNPIGPIVDADEGFHHQIPDTFAVVGPSDPAWTEKVCAMAMSRDGSIQLGFGMGKYTNRNVLDGYGAVSRGKEQWTVRGSRALATDPECTAVAPLRYEVLEPRRVVRFALDANDVQPVAFEWTFEASLPTTLEDRTVHQDGFRTSADLVRYHQIGVGSGWVDIEGERTELTTAGCVSTRDHSWGVRYGVGVPPPDVPEVDALAGLGFQMVWCPLLFERHDGSRYGMLLHFQIVTAPGLGVVHKIVMGGIEHLDGSYDPWVDLAPELSYDARNRRLRGGVIRATPGDGVTRELAVEVLDDTGIQLGAGLYFGFDGHHHGEWRGQHHVDGEHFDDCATPENARRLHQIRDTVIRVTDPVGGGVGLGNCQPIITGGHPELGLSPDDTFW
ncbi:MAG: hypothetical protein ACXVL8_19935 [Acidimicrobiia bacterium]